MRDQAVPEVHRIAHQEAALPETGERTCSRPRQDKHHISEWGDNGSTRGFRGIPGRPP